MTKMLIISFSPLASDARVLKQIREFAGDYDVTTCGYGESPDPRVEHVRVPDDVRVDQLNPKLILLRQYALVHRTLSGVRWAREELGSRRGEFDIILANDIDTVPLARWLHPRKGVHADLHEFSPSLHEEHPPWKRLIAPYYSWLCRRSLPAVASVTTVSRGLQRAYGDRYGVAAELVTNAAPFVDAVPTEVHRPIRLVHSGAGLRNRGLHDTIEGVLRSSADVTLDMFLTPNHPDYVEELRNLAARSGGRVRVNDPVPYRDLPATLRSFDVGVFVLEPVNFSYRWALPNKLFDYVQARLGVIVGPSPEAAEFVEREQIGVITGGFTPTDIARTIDALNPESVASFKQAAHERAQQLSATPQIEVWRRAVDALRDGDGDGVR